MPVLLDSYVYGVAAAAGGADADKGGGGAEIIGNDEVHLLDSGQAGGRTSIIQAVENAVIDERGNRAR